MAAAQVDVPRLAAYVNFPEDHIATLAIAPSPELVQALLVRLAQKATEHEQLAAAKLRVDVELENAVRGTEQKARLMKGNLEKAQKQIADLQQQLDAQQNSRQALETELETIRSSTSTSSSELTTLQQRISSLESSNRDTLALLESKSRAHDGLAQDLSAKHQKTVELRREVTDLEDKLRAAGTAATTNKFREQALEQEVESLKRSNDYLDNELKTKTAEYTKFRKDKSARIAELQRQHEDDTTTIESLQRAVKALRTRASELEQKAEDYLTQIQHVKEDLARQEEAYRAELDTANRLQELMKEQAETEKNRRADLQEQYENVQDEAREEFAKIEEEMKTIQDDKDAAERRVTELEATVERLETDIATVSAAPIATTPRFNASVRPGSAPRTPVRGMSPSAPGSAMRNSTSYTQMVTDFHEARKDRDALRRRNQELEEQLDSMMQDLEQRRPALEQMSSEHERLQSDVAEMSGLIESIGKERDAAKREARNCQGQVKGLIHEGDILRQQLRDLSSQIKILLLEVNARDQGQDSFTADERIRLEQLATSDDPDRDYRNDTDQFISQNLVPFKNIAELQAQNEKLLRVTRELGEKMEGEEAQLRQTQAAQDHEEVQELRQKYERVRDEMKSLMTQSQAYIRERDIFRRMLSHRGQIAPQSDIESAFGQSVNGEVPITPARNGLHASVEMSPKSKDLADYTKLIKEMQSHFDGYKQEAASERTQLKDQVSTLTAKNGELRNELARKSGELLLATERYEMLQGNYTMLKTENGELQKRTQTASDRAAQQELRVQNVATELLDNQATIESLRNASANLKAEKEFWKTIEKRITDDNRALITERDRINTLNANLQNLLNEREHSENDSRRRLQSQIETLESETQTAKRKLAEIEEETKRNTLRNEFDSQQAQSRIDDLFKTLSTTREELAASKATRDQLQLRVDELTIELRSAEERLQVLSRPSGDNTTDLSNTSSGGQDQELALQISELKRDLELAKRDLTSAQEQVEQYKQISQDSEEGLQSLNDSHDQYRQEMDQLIEEKENKIKELEETIDRMRREADESFTELETLRTATDSHEQSLREQRTQLETEIGRLRDTAERAETAAQFHQEDLKAQVVIARQAQENYDNELQRHAEASKVVQAVRNELSEVKLELVELRTAKESAQSTLATAEESWNETKTRYENEMTEIRTRRDDVSRQNKLLHEQLEKVNAQITELQRSRAAGGAPVENSNATSSGDDGSLQELIRYLRREKEIVDVQYEMASQESRRLRQQLEHTQNQLEETRLKLSQQLRSEEERERSALNHNKLIETINELNMTRESNATLRLEKTQAQNTLGERNKEVEDLQSQLQPLHAKVQELEDIRDSQTEELRMTREARERFEQRYHDLLNKTDSVDPAEFESVKEKSAALETERDEFKSQAEALQGQVDEIPTQIENALKDLRETSQASREKLKQQAKDKNAQQVARIREVEASLQSAKQESEKLKVQLDEVRIELESANNDKVDLQANLSQAQTSQPSATTADGDSQVAALQEQLSQANAKVESHGPELMQLQQQLGLSQARVLELEQSLTEVQANLKQAQDHAEQQVAGAPNEAATAQPVLDTEHIDKLREELAAAQKDVDALRAAATINEHAGTVQEGEGQPTIAEQIAKNVDAIRAELEQRHEERLAAAEKKANDRVQQMKEVLTKKMKEFKVTTTDQLKAEHDAQIEKLNQEHRQELEQLENRYKAELEELKQQAGKVSPKTETNGNVDSTSPATALPTLQTDEAVKEFLQTSAVAKRILAANIQKRVHEARTIAAKETEEKLAEAETNARAAQEAAVKQAKESASEMEAKKQLVKLNMAQNQLRNANVKVDYVKTAATSTPEKTVSEVWNVAKDLKPPPAAAGGLAKSAFAPSATSSPAAKVAAPQSVSQPATQNTPAASNPFAVAKQGPPSATAATTEATQASSAPVSNPFAKPKAAAEPAQVAKTETEAEPETSAEQQENDNAERTASPGGPARPPSSQARLPDASLGATAGRGRGGSNSTLPVPGGRGGQQTRGIPRGNFGRGGGRGRGSGIPQPGAQGGAGGMNAAAKQFVPQKRGLEGSDHAGPDKRQRGGKN